MDAARHRVGALGAVPRCQGRPRFCGKAACSIPHPSRSRHQPRAGWPQKAHGAFPSPQRARHVLPDGAGKSSAVAHPEQIEGVREESRPAACKLSTKPRAALGPALPEAEERCRTLGTGLLRASSHAAKSPPGWEKSHSSGMASRDGDRAGGRHVGPQADRGAAARSRARLEAPDKPSLLKS